MDEKIVSLNKKSQVSIWVIVGIILVAAVLLFLLIDRNVVLIKPGEGEATFDVESYIKTCSSGFVNDITDSMLPKGGICKSE